MKSAWSFALVLAVSGVGKAVADDLLTVYQQALGGDPKLKAAGLKLNIGTSQKEQSFGEFLPQVTATGNWSHNDQTISGGAREVNTTYPGKRYYISVNQSLVDLAKFWNWRRAKETENVYIEEQLEAENALIDDVVERYFDLLQAEDQLNLLRGETEALTMQHEQIKRQFAKQLVKITDLYEVEARLDQLQASQIEAETVLVKARENLREMTNNLPQDLARLREDIEYRPLEGNLEDWIAVAKSENPLLRAQLSAIEAASDDVAMQRARHLPVVDLQFNYFNSDTGYQSSRTPQTEVQTAAINVSVPIFSGGVISEKTNEAQHRLELAKNENESKIRGLVKEISDAFLTSNASVRRIAASAKALESAKKSREAKEKGFKFGLETVGDVLDAQQAEFRAKRDLALGRYSYVKSRMRFLHAVGVISPQNLQEVNEWLYQPQSTSPN
ncbi:TolC family outer membrane protein [Methylomonas sp. DH-1]|uniref:TolC family outer membrane protein n=1 Tax=Methylomonas sp. (strain DH-1) TaxID=1727196 RepID=UPI0007C96341|nr:TolC family outer membrane protein [Methylomonas sp. DH-1]ANE56803.1 type I secretion protein TolC [Methylomonas sp. DH-1]